jgi:hypothetical protein
VIVASIFTGFWSSLVEHDEQGLFLVLVGFILSFAFIRMSTRLMRSPKVPWWPGSVVSDSGVHLHHPGDRLGAGIRDRLPSAIARGHDRTLARPPAHQRRLAPNNS